MKDVRLMRYPWPILIVPCQSGVQWHTRSGGEWCNHQCEEGVVVPLLMQSWQYIQWQERTRNAGRGLHVGHYGKLNGVEANDLDQAFREIDLPLWVNRERLTESEEAWVFVDIRGTQSWHGLRGFEGSDAILTWENCD